MPSTAFESGKYWTKSISPSTGCTPYRDRLEPCRICWAREMTKLRPQVDGGCDFRPTYHESRVNDLMRPKNHVVFANIMGDWCHEAFSHGQRWTQLLAMGNAHRSVFLTCTKRTGALEGMARVEWPMNVWAGATAWDLPSLDRALGALSMHRTWRWLSLEPLLSDLDDGSDTLAQAMSVAHWAAIGPETGARGKRRPCSFDRIRQAIKLCRKAGVVPFVKAVDLGTRISHDPGEWPEDLRVRELPPELERILLGKA